MPSVKWWRDYAAECAAFDAWFWPTVDPNRVEAWTEDCIMIRVRLYCEKPMYYGVFHVDVE